MQSSTLVGGVPGHTAQGSGAHRHDPRMDLAFAQELEKLKREWNGKAAPGSEHQAAMIARGRENGGDFTTGIGMGGDTSGGLLRQEVATLGKTELALDGTRLENSDILLQVLEKDTAGSRDRDKAGYLIETEGAMPWLEALDSLQVVAQSHPSLMSLFQPLAAPQVAQGPNPVATQIENIVQKLVEQAELGPLQSPKEMSNVQVSLDRSIFGLSGFGLSVTQGSVAVVLLGLQNPSAEKLAAAGQVLVRELQKHFPNRTIRILASDEEKDGSKIAGTAQDSDSPVLALAQREFAQGGRK